MTNLYGVKETNSIGAGYHENVTSSITRSVPWTTKGLRITRLRLITDPGLPFWDVSYCHGFIGSEPVEVHLPFSQLPRRGMNAFIVKEAQRDKVYAKGLGILNPLIISTLV